MVSQKQGIRYTRVGSKEAFIEKVGRNRATSAALFGHFFRFYAKSAQVLEKKSLRACLFATDSQRCHFRTLRNHATSSAK